MTIVSGDWLKQRLIRSASRFSSDAVIADEIGERLLDHLDFINKPIQTILVWEVLPGVVSEKLRARFPGATIHGVPCWDQVLLCQADQSVDLVVMNLTWLYLSSSLQSLHALARVLKTEGLLLLSSLGPDTLCELKEAWGGVDQQTHVATFEDMHTLGDALMANFFVDPVLDREHLHFEYDNVKTLARDLRYSALNLPVLQGNTGLITPRQWQRLEAHYRGDQECITASFEVIYGHAWRAPTPLGVVKPVDGVAEIAVDAVRTRTP
jgi:malonyl-CoA O-methyltransferase